MELGGEGQLELLQGLLLVSTMCDASVVMLEHHWSFWFLRSGMFHVITPFAPAVGGSFGV